MTSEATKQPLMSKPRLQVKLVTPIYYMTKFQGSFILAGIYWIWI